MSARVRKLPRRMWAVIDPQDVKWAFTVFVQKTEAMSHLSDGELHEVEVRELRGKKEEDMTDKPTPKTHRNSFEVAHKHDIIRVVRIEIAEELEGELAALRGELDADERMIKNLAPTGRYNGLDIEGWYQRANAAEALLAQRGRDEERLRYLYDNKLVCRPIVSFEQWALNIDAVRKEIIK